MSATTAMEAASTMGTTATVEPACSMGVPKARLAARRKASDISAVIKATERAGVGSWLWVRRWATMKSWISASGSASVECVAVVEIAAVVIESGVIEVVAVDDRAAVGDIGVVVVSRAVTVPIIIPVMPAPPKSSKEADAEADSESNPRSGQEKPRHGIPAGIGDDRLAIYEPGIVGRHIDHFRIGRLNDDCVALGRYFLLFIAAQVASLVSLLTHRLNSIRDILLLVGIGVAKR